jgi:hypothetical protein
MILVADAGRPVAYERQVLDEWASNPDVVHEIHGEHECRLSRRARGHTVNATRLHPSAVNKFRQLMEKADDRKSRLNALRQWLASKKVNTAQ